MPFATMWMNLETVMLSEVIQTQKDRYDIAYMWNLKKRGQDTNELTYKTDVKSQMQKTNLWLPGDIGGDKLEDQD